MEHCIRIVGIFKKKCIFILKLIYSHCLQETFAELFNDRKNSENGTIREHAFLVFAAEEQA